MLEPCEHPEARLRTFGVRAIRRSYRVIRTPDELKRALDRHTTHVDVPANTHASAAYLLSALARGKQLVQFAFEIPAAAAGATPRIIRRPLPSSALVIGAYSLSGVTAVSRRAVYDAMQGGIVDTIESTWRGTPHQYAVLTPRMRAWLSVHSAWMYATDLQHPWYSEPSAEDLGHLCRTDAAGRLLIHTGYEWVEWVCKQRPFEERRRILEAQVTTAKTGDPA